MNSQVGEHVRCTHVHHTESEGDKGVEEGETQHESVHSSHAGLRFGHQQGMHLVRTLSGISCRMWYRLQQCLFLLLDAQR